MIMSNEHCACARTESEIDDFSHVKPHRIAAALLDNLAFDQFIVSVECGNANVFLIQPEQPCAKEIARLASSRQILTICPVLVYVVDVDSENVGQICKKQRCVFSHTAHLYKIFFACVKHSAAFNTPANEENLSIRACAISFVSFLGTKGKSKYSRISCGCIDPSPLFRILSRIRDLCPSWTLLVIISYNSGYILKTLSSSLTSLTRIVRASSSSLNPYTFPMTFHAPYACKKSYQK